MIENQFGGRQNPVEAEYHRIHPGVWRALGILLADGAKTHHDPDGTNWQKITVTEHLNHAQEHILKFQESDTSEDHLLHALCRLHFAKAMTLNEAKGGLSAL